MNGTLQQAGESRGTEYVKLREDFLKGGSASLLNLKKAAVDGGLTWQQRLVARIWVEWLERRTEIESLRHYDWGRDPEFSPKMLSNHIGPWVEMVPLMRKRFKERRLWYYYCEAEVMDSHERWAVPSGLSWIPDHWAGMSWEALGHEPEFYYSIARMRDTLRRDPDLKTEEARRDRFWLEHLKVSDAIPELLACYLASRRVVEEKFGQDGGRTKRLGDLIKMAGSQHAALFDAFIAAHAEFFGLKSRVDQLRGRPPAKEWEEPSYNPAHESEALQEAQK